MKLEVTSLRIKFFVTLLVPLILYWQDIILIGNEAFNSDLSTHIVLLPFLLGYMVYRLKNVLTVSVSFNSKEHLIYGSIKFREAIGALMCLTGYVVKWYGSYTFNPLEYHVASMIILVSGLVLILFNVHTFRFLLFPLLFLVFLIPPPIDFAYSIGSFLSILSARLSVVLLKLGGYPTVLNNVYGTPIIYLTRPDGVVVPFTIDLACSGLYSFIGLIVFATFFAYISTGSILKKMSVFTVSFPIVYALNVVRITLLILVGFFMGTGLTLNLFHLLSGWILIFLGTMTILLLADRLFKIKILQLKVNACQHDEIDRQDKVCLICGKLIGVKSSAPSRLETAKLITFPIIAFLLMSLQAPVFALSSGQVGVFAKGSIENLALNSALPVVDGYDLSFVYRDTEFEGISGQNASLMYQYEPSDHLKTTIYVGLEIGSIRSSLHGWETCLLVMPELGKGEIYNKVDLRDVHLIENPPLSARYFAFNRIGANLTEVILYWYTQSIFKIGDTYQRMWTKISVIQYASEPTYYMESEVDILPVAEAIANYWRPIQKWSWLGINLAKNGLVITAVAVILLASAVGYDQIRRGERRRQNNLLVNSLDSDDDKILFSVIRESGNKSMNECDLRLRLSEYLGKEIDALELHSNLKKAEDLGLIDSIIINIDNEPYLGWKGNF